ncbi:Gfo/Idh/MocA family oxidoreductase [Saccharopolyspora erythraea]|uniref:Gfo/Idh/MocA family oxidoreductase n=1 Tax=Saccharopolyspora erythraea TaxID=1836 RepID=UPI001BADF59F|nr:Gfo/Idh/MocA family oxidoreductase [Saccharopolyspora erythraea]QUH04174.1 Gfo/Idh/MocA family oxidoreductase [Saccharopolyspora erythraea]
MTTTAPVVFGLIGAGAIGAFHAESLARRIPEARLAAVADPRPEAAQQLAASLDVPRPTSDPSDLFADPDIEAVVITTPPQFHTDLIETAAAAGKAVFCEKPMALSLADADRAITATAKAGVALQIGFNRRYDRGFRAGHDLVTSGGIGRPQLLRSLTRDPELSDPARVPAWGIFLETLIHDFDTLNWLNLGTRATEVYATADALVRPDWKERGLLDTALVHVRYDNGAMATAEASFQALYGYDVRGEVFGSEGMATMGDIRPSTMTAYGAHGVRSDSVRRNVDLFHDAYTAQLTEFARCVRNETPPQTTGEDARSALAIALAAIESVRTGQTVRIDSIEQ